MKPSSAVAFALSLAGLFASESARAEGDREEMRAAVMEYSRSSFVLATLSYAGFVGSFASGLIFWLGGRGHHRVIGGAACFGYGFAYGGYATALINRGVEWVRDDSSRLGNQIPARFASSERRELDPLGFSLNVGMVANASVFALTLPLYYPFKGFKDWKLFAIATTVESVFSAGLGIGLRYSLDKYEAALSKYGGMEFDGSMKPSTIPPFVIRAKFAF